MALPPMVLIVETNQLLRPLLRDMVHLACPQATCLTPLTGAEATELCHKVAPDLILFDTESLSDQAGSIARALQWLAPEARWIIFDEFGATLTLRVGQKPHTWLAKHSLHTHLLPVLRHALPQS